MTVLAHAQAPAAPRRAVFRRHQYFTPGVLPLLDKFISRFHPYSYIYKYQDAADGWLSAKDSRWRLAPSDIAKAICCVDNKLLGTRWGKETQHAVLDIDKNSQYHKLSSLKRILKTLQVAGLANPVVYQSSASGGWHIYIFFDRPIPSRKLQQYLTRLLQQKGFVIQNGTLEVFPNPGTSFSLGQGLRLPLQAGWAWLDQETFKIRFERDEFLPSQALARFMSDLDENIHSLQQYNDFVAYVDHLQEVVETATIYAKPKVAPLRATLTLSSLASPDALQLATITEIFGTLPPGIIPERWLSGRTFAKTGLTEESQRHEANLALNHYFFYGDPSQSISPLGYPYADERETLVKHVLSSKHNGKSSEINKGRPEALSDISRAAHWRPVHKRNDTTVVETQKFSPALAKRNKFANLKRANEARQKIKHAVDKMLEQRKPIRVNDLAKLADVPPCTLYKHPDLWRQHYEEQRLAAVMGEYSVGMNGLPTEKPVQSPPDNKKDPAELLAARQIVHELKARIAAQKEKTLKERLSTSKAIDSRWQTTLSESLSLLPEEMTAAGIGTLKLVLNILQNLRPLAPSEEDMTMTDQHIEAIKTELDLRYSVPVGFACPASSSSTSILACDTG